MKRFVIHLNNKKNVILDEENNQELFNITINNPGFIKILNFLLLIKVPSKYVCESKDEQRFEYTKKQGNYREITKLGENTRIIFEKTVVEGHKAFKGVFSHSNIILVNKYGTEMVIILD